MAVFNGMTITSAGENMLAQAIDGQGTLIFTSMSTSTQQISGNLDSIVALTDIKQTVTPTSAVINNNAIQVTGDFTNVSVQQQYDVNTIGLYAKLGNGTEMLFAVASASTPDTIPAQSTPFTFSYVFNVAVSNTAQIVVNIEGGSTSNYNDLFNKPQLNGVDLIGNKTLDDVGAVAKNQGTGNAGKVLGIGENGIVTPMESGGGIPGQDGEDGGYYTPTVTQPTDETMQMSFAASKPSMPPVQPVTINLPSGGDASNGLPSGGTAGQVLSKKTDADYDVEWVDINDGGKTDSINLIDNSKYQNSGYSGTLFNEFGASINVFNSEIDVSENKILYYRIYRNNQIYNNIIFLKVACYDSDGTFLFLMDDSNGEYVENFESVSRQNGTNSEPLETVNGNKVVVKGIGIVNIPENVKKVKFGIPGNSPMIQDFYPAFAVSYSTITNYGSISDGDYTLVQGESNSDVGESELNYSKPLLNKTFLMIGDSLTNWGGGGDASDGFLKIIHDRTGVNTVNQGLSGATWEEAEGQTQSGVTRVDAYVSGSVRYDCVGFLLGTNVANQGNTTDTSSTKTTMCGAIKYCLEKLITLSPTTPIIVFLPPQRAEGNAEQKTRNDMIKQICEIYGVYTFDLYTHSQVIPNTTVEDNGTLSDGLHLSEKGQQNFGRIMSSAILNVMGY